MAKIGKTNQLPILRHVSIGLYLDGGDLGEILIPNRYVPEGSRVGDVIEVFIYLDSEDRLIATTEIPYVEVGGCAHLEVVATNNLGSFMDWGLPKDLFIPFKEQRVPMEIGRFYTVVLYLDNTERIAASSRLHRFLALENKGHFTPGQAVDLQVASRSDLGYLAVIDGTHLGLIHKNEIFQPISVGDQMRGYIKDIRPDERINLTLYAKGALAMDDLSKTIIDFLKAEGGSSTLTDKSPADEIYKAFNVSKSTYKKALGKLYKEKHIQLGKDLISLLPSS